MSIYHAPSFIPSWQYSLMEPPSDTWLKARTVGAQQQLESTPNNNSIQFNPVYNNNNNNNNKQLADLFTYEAHWANFQNIVKKKCTYGVLLL